MKMIKCYAIEPNALRRWEDFRYVMEKLGFDKGRVLVTIPGKWISNLLNSLGDVGDIERSRFIAKLQRYKQDRIISSGSPYDPAIFWVDNASALETLGVIDAILISDDTLRKNQMLSYPTPSLVDESFFETSRELRCLNTPENLGLSAKVLLGVSSEAIFVDPHFRIDSDAYLKTLAEFSKHASAGRECKFFTIFTRSDYAPKRGQPELRNRLDQNLSPFVKQGFKVRVNFLERKTTGISFHARYLLTTRGGIRYDKGFRSELPPELVDISLLDRRLHEELLEVFSPGSDDLKIAETWEWIATAQS